MKKNHKHQISSYGMLLGALALLISIFHFSYGPFSIKPSLESVVAEKISSIKSGILAGLKGKEPPVSIQKNKISIDNVLNGLGIGLSIIALVLAFMGGVRRENGWSVSGALFFGGVTLTFHAMLFGIGLIFCIIILVVVLWLLLSFFHG